MSGGFYLTEYSPGLEDLYVPDREVVWFETVEELIDKTKYYVAHESEVNEIREAGFIRARNEHTMERRFEYVLHTIGLI
ncbi:MAG: glycosyltransferase family 1 protein, partial [Candidatus Latescibacteria bacterium]|nr:glycosyltransferase family 1 protein [Candidatus Latescibacterota bacterium]